MSYAVRNDGKGWRAVDSAADAQPDETFAAEQPRILEVALEPLGEATPEGMDSDPVAKLVAWLKANPDVMALLQ